MLKRVFEDIQKDKDRWLQSRSGDDFEQRFETALKKYGFNRIFKTDIERRAFKKIKAKIQNKRSDHLIENPFEKRKEFCNCFIFQPFGSQNFPDFLIFGKKFLLAIEIKYSKDKAVKPMWNSNLPKGNAVYIFGSYLFKDITFFVGGDVLPMREREDLIDFFEEVKKHEYQFQKDKRIELSVGKIKNERGFNVYIRRAFDQNKNINKNAKIDYFNHPERINIEKKVFLLLDQINS